MSQVRKIIKHANYKTYQNDQETAAGIEIDDLYLVIYGRVTIYKDRIKARKLIEGCIFEKNYFVELTRDPIEPKRPINFTLKAKKDTMLLIITKDDFYNVIYNHMRDELHHKLYTLRSCNIFIDVKTKDLIDLASNLSLVTKTYNEVIVKQWQKLTKCYIVAKGVCKSVIDRINNVSTIPSVYARRSELPPQKALLFGMRDFHTAQPSPRGELHKKKQPITLSNYSYNNQLVGSNNSGVLYYKSHVRFRIK